MKKNINNNTKKKKKGNGEGTLYYSESKKRWVLQETFIDAGGNKCRKTFYGKTATEARQKKQAFISDVSSGKAQIKNNKKTSYTVCDIIKCSIERDFKMNKFSEASYTRKLSSLKIIENNIMGTVSVSKINKTMVENFLYDLTNYADSTIKKTYSLLKNGLAESVKNNYISQNYLELPEFSYPRSNKFTKDVRAFTLEEQNQFLLALSNYKKENNRGYYKNQMLIELFTGMRMGEINALTPNDIDLKNRVVRVSKTITRGIDYLPAVGKTTKTVKGIREVPLNDNALLVFKEALDEYVPNKQNLLFYDFNKNSVITTNQVNLAFKRICDKNGIYDNATQHMLRHTFATRCIEAGIDAYVLKEWLGHTDISITLGTYCDVFSKMHNNAIEKLQSYTDKEIVKLNSVM